jgi:hypothetical protein
MSTPPPATPDDAGHPAPPPPPPFVTAPADDVPAAAPAAPSAGSPSAGVNPYAPGVGGSGAMPGYGGAAGYGSAPPYGGAPAYGNPSPYGAAPTYGAPGGFPTYGPPPPGYAAPRTNGMAIASLATSLSALFIGISAPVGLVLGIVALRQIRRDGTLGRGLAVAGTAIGGCLTFVGLAFTVFLVAGLSGAFGDPSEEFATGFSQGFEDSVDGGAEQGGGWSSQVDVAQMVTGDCLGEPIGWGGEAIYEVTVVACSAPHAEEVIASQPSAATVFPGDEALEVEVDDWCFGAADAAMPPDHWDDGGYYTWLVPSEESWSEGDRELVCLLGNELNQISGSYREGTATLVP